MEGMVEGEDSGDHDGADDSAWALQQPSHQTTTTTKTTTMGDSKAEQKEADKAEAERRGLTYKQIRHERRKRETDRLEDSEHGREVKRLRAYSHDGTAADAAAAKRRSRCRSDFQALGVFTVM